MKDLAQISSLAAIVLSCNLSCTGNNQKYVNHPANNSASADQISLLLKKAEDYQTIHFGEDHQRPEDNKFMLSLFPAFKEKGFNYFAFELDSYVQPMIDAYFADAIAEEDFNQIFPYQPEETLPLLKAAHSSGYQIVLFDETPEGQDLPGDETLSKWGTDRALKQFNNIKEKIFAAEPDAKVIVFSGRTHIDEVPRFYHITGQTEKALGFFLEQYTRDRNLSVSLVEDEYKRQCLPNGYVKPDLSLNIK